MATTYLTNNEWAQNKGYKTLAARIEAGFTYPNDVVLDIKRDSAYAIINDAIGNAVTKTNYMRSLEFDIVEIMLDTEISRATREEAIIETLNRYITPEWLERLDEQDDSINRGCVS